MPYVHSGTLNSELPLEFIALGKPKFQRRVNYEWFGLVNKSARRSLKSAGADVKRRAVESSLDWRSTLSTGTGVVFHLKLRRWSVAQSGGLNW